MKHIVIALTLVVSLFSVVLQAQAPGLKPAPELKKLDVFVGEWTYEGDTKESPLGPAGKISGKQTIRWALNGFFQEWKSVEKGILGDTESIEFDWYDAATKSYPYQQFQNNGNTISGSGTVSGNVWNYSWVMNQKGRQYKFRNVITIATDGMSWTWNGEISTDGKSWMPWADFKATRIKPTPKK